MKYVKIFEGFKDDKKDMSLEDLMSHEDSYKQKVRNCLYHIAMKDRNISEKNFSRLDLLDEQLESFYESSKKVLDEIIDEFESSHKRPEYCAEKIYDEFQF